MYVDAVWRTACKVAVERHIENLYQDARLPVCVACLQDMQQELYVGDMASPNPPPLLIPLTRLNGGNDKSKAGAASIKHALAICGICVLESFEFKSRCFGMIVQKFLVIKRFVCQNTA